MDRERQEPAADQSETAYLKHALKDNYIVNAKSARAAPAPTGDENAKSIQDARAHRGGRGHV
jgi:hypothetical protein